MENIIDRLVKYMAFRKLNPNKITTDAQLSVGLIGKSIKASKGLHSDTIEKILYTYKEINPEWFLLGTGEMLREKENFVLEEPVATYSSEPPKESLLVQVLLNQIQELQKDKSTLQKEKEDLYDLLKSGKSGKANAS